MSRRCTCCSAGVLPMRSFLFLIYTIAAATVCGAELQIRTTDGQTVQGEYLGTENKIVKVRTKFGIVQIPSKDIVTLTAVAAPAAPAGVAGETPAAPVGGAGVPVPIGVADAPVFPEVKR